MKSCAAPPSGIATHLLRQSAACVCAGLEVEGFSFIDDAFLCDGDAAAHDGAMGVMCCCVHARLLNLLIPSSYIHFSGRFSEERGAGAGAGSRGEGWKKQDIGDEGKGGAEAWMRAAERER